MAYLDNITANGHSVQSTGLPDNTPIIPGLTPLIVWEYVNDAAELGQNRFELKIGTSSTDWGLDSYTGNIADIDESSESNFYQYKNHNLSRGNTYYGQVRARDENNNKTNWVQFIFKINRLPFVTNYRLSPTSPATSEDIELDYTYHDADSHDQSGSKIRWFKNGIHQPAYDDICILTYAATSPGDSWSAKIIPSDGLEYGQVVETSSVLVQSISQSVDPVTGHRLIQNVKVLPKDANVDDILKVDYDIVESPYIAIDDFIEIEWYKNDTLIENSNQRYIRPEMKPGDEIYAVVKVVADDETNLIEIESNPVTIDDVVWHVFNLEISGQRESVSLPDRTPVLNWQIHKTTAESRDKPSYLRVVVNRSDTLGEPIVYDSGYIDYTKNSYQIPSGYLNWGETYFFHVAAGDTKDIDSSLYDKAHIRLAGSNWESSVNNDVGWTVEFKMQVPDAYDGGSPLNNPYTPDEVDGSPYNLFEEGKTMWEENLPVVEARAIADGEWAPADPNINYSFVEEVNVSGSGFLLRRVYTATNSYLTGDFLDGATQPYDPESTDGLAWQACYTGYYQMNIPARREELAEGSEILLNIHDGRYYGSVGFQFRTIRFTSTETATYTVPTSKSNLTLDHIYRIEAQGKSLWIYVDNELVLTASGTFNAPTGLRKLEFGDFNTKRSNTAILSFFRYTTVGIRGTDTQITGSDTFHFQEVARLAGGSIDFITDNRLSWTPDDTSESSKIYNWNPYAPTNHMVAANRSFSPITAIYIDSQRNKYVGTANGLTAIYGEKHEADYSFNPTDNARVLPEDFDRITNIPSDRLVFVEQTRIPNWLSIDTTYRATGTVPTSVEIDAYTDDPYLTTYRSHAIHYYSQRVPGHAWFDRVDNETGWRVSFSFFIEKLEADDYEGNNLEHNGFGVYINDGARQEILYFYEDRIKLFYANVYIPVDTTRRRDYTITAKDQNIYIYQKPKTGSVGSYNLLLDGSGLFTAPATSAANSVKPKVVLGSDGTYHAVWTSDGNGRARVFHASHDGTNWSWPEVVTESTQFDLRNADVGVDSQGRTWVVYEDTSWGPTEISVSVKDNAGWNPKVRITNSPSDKGKPVIAIDPVGDVHVVWEDKRNGHWEIWSAWWEDEVQAWHSSGQFGSDIVVMQYDEEDPYITGGTVEFRNPQVSLLYPRLWLVCEAHEVDLNQSQIYLGYRDLESNQWVGSGVAELDDAGEEVTGTYSAFVASPAGRYAVNPTIASNSYSENFCVAWEDQTSPVSQIWGRTYSTSGGVIKDSTQVTSSLTDCHLPSAGSVSTDIIIAYESNGLLYAVAYNQASLAFQAASQIQTDSKKTIVNPCIVDSDPSRNFMVLYDYSLSRDSSLQSDEFPDFQMIGDALARYQTGTTTSLDDGRVSEIDTKEFAFGDISENVGMIAHWRNFEMYFGYDARPYSIMNFNTGNAWPDADDRITDLFVDVYGNLVVASYGGLVYFNTFVGKPVYINDLAGTPAYAIKWCKSGKWAVATQSGLYVSENAGASWSNIDDSSFQTLSINNKGVLIAGSYTDSSVKINVYDATEKTFGSPTAVITLTDVIPNIQVLAIDDENIVWVGSTNGLYRIENFSEDYVIHYDYRNGMRSSYVNDIAIVNKNLRYVATVTGIERMYGTRFTSINVHTHDLLVDNVYRLKWDADTNSLWAGSAYQLHEIVFRDQSHEAILDENVAYSHYDLLTEQLIERDRYFFLDAPDLPISNYQDSSTVYINKNPIEHGYTVPESGLEVQFDCNLLLSDQVEASVSNMFSLLYDFNQLDAEKDIVGEQRTVVQKIVRTTTTGDDFYLTGGTAPSILMDAGWVQVPFATIMLDIEPPLGCIEMVGDPISRSLIKFRIIAYDRLSGVDSYMLSNHPNFTEDDGDTPLEWSPISDTVLHDIGLSMNNTNTAHAFPDTFNDGQTVHDVGSGSKAGIWINEADGNRPHIIVATSNPVTIWRYYPENDPNAISEENKQWQFLQRLDEDDTSNSRSVTTMKTINTSLYMTTETSLSGGLGQIYRMTDGLQFELVGQVNDQSARGIADAADRIVFGSGNGDIYEYDPVQESQPTVVVEGIGDGIYALDIYNRTLMVCSYQDRDTGPQARVYSLNIDTLDNIIEYVRSGTVFNDIYIHNKDKDPQEAYAYLSLRDKTEVYRANMDELSFIKSYASFGATVNRITTVSKKVLDHTDTSGEYTVVAAVGDLLLQHAGTWEYVYRHDEGIQDVIELEFSGEPALYIVSENKITRWSQVTETSTKTVYLKLKDRAGNVSASPLAEPFCPVEGDSDTNEVTCCGAYSIKIEDIQDFVNDSRLIDVDSGGTVQYSFDSPTGNPIYSADRIDVEKGLYTSEIFNGSANIVSWKSITWDSTEPSGTSINVQIRHGSSEDDVLSQPWSTNLEPDGQGIVNIEYITQRYIQFRVLMESTVRNSSPTLSSVTLRNITTQSSHFFTTNFVLPSRPIKGLLTANTYIPVSSDIIFGLTTENTTDFDGSYQIIENNRLFQTSQGQFESNLRIGAKLLSPSVPLIQEEEDPYTEAWYFCAIDFNYQNLDTTPHDYHFRIKFYNDVSRTQLIHTFSTANDQTGWEVEGGEENFFPANGQTIAAGTSKRIYFRPYSEVEQDQKWYISIDAYNGTTWETVSNDRVYVCQTCYITNEPGLIAEYYQTGLSDFTAIPNFGRFTPDHILIEDRIDFNKPSGSEWITNDGTILTGYGEGFAARFRGRLHSPVAGTYTFYLTSNDGSKLYINGTEVIDNDGVHVATEKTGNIYLSSGYQDIEVHFFQNTDNATLVLKWLVPGQTSEVTIPPERLYHPVTNEYCEDRSAPRIMNFAVMFELENGETVKLNLT